MLAVAILGCLALSAPLAVGNDVAQGVARKSNAGNPNLATSTHSINATTCVVFRNGFEPAADWLFRDGFEQASIAPADAGAPITFVTSGGYIISVNLDNVTITDALGLNKLVHSGHQHEYLNGKQIKDWGGESNWDDDRRSLILGDGVKVTLVAQGHPNTIMQTSIYDGDENLQIENACNNITHRSVDQADTRQRDQAQYDGETATFETDEILGTSTYANAYDEYQNFNILDIVVMLGTTGGYASPNKVTDLYDDPRVNHT